VRQLTKAKCKKVFREVASGAKTDRAQLRRLLDQLEAGDVLTVTRLDRLARSTRAIFPSAMPISTRRPSARRHLVRNASTVVIASSLTSE
jgi:DNA invertase Pin-like site-specific DNA recombinase